MQAPTQVDEWHENVLWAAGLQGRQAQWFFDTFPVNAKNAEAKDSVEEWAKVVSSPGLCLYGPPGSGKTGLAISALVYRIQQESAVDDRWMILADPSVRDAVRQGRIIRQRPGPLWFERWLHLHDRLHQAKIGALVDMDEHIDSFLGMMAELDEVIVLVVDDIDAGTFTDWKEEVILRLLERTEQNKSLILTMNNHPSQLIQKLGGRIADRILESDMFLHIHVGGETLRRR